MPPNVPVLPNHLSGEAPPNTLRGLNRSGPLGLASAPGGGRMAAIPVAAGGWLGRSVRVAVVAAVVGAFAALLLLFVVTP